MVSPGSTPQSVSALHVRGCGCPRKALIPPSYDDKPENVSKEELLKWKKQKNTAEWHYNKLTSEDADVFREREKSSEGPGTSAAGNQRRGAGLQKKTKG